MAPKRLPLLQREDGIDYPDVQEAVKDLQKLLGFSPDEIDGRFESDTENAVKHFQSYNGLLSDGVVGPKTWSALLQSADIEVYAHRHLSQTGAFDLEKIINSITIPAIRQIARESLPIILRECDTSGVKDRGQIAYILATAEHESQLGLLMVELDPGWIYEGRLDLDNTEPGDGPKFKGRGFVQVTGRKNYTEWSNRLGIDLVNRPERATEFRIAAQILVQGMRDGTFTGVGLSDFITGEDRDFFQARKIVCGLDRAARIASIAEEYWQVLV